MTYTTEQESWILNQIKKSVNSYKMIELRQSEQLTEGKAYQIERELEFLRYLEIQNRIHI